MSKQLTRNLANTSETVTHLRTAIQRFGTFLSGMIMPNIGAFIAWGTITALFIPTGIIPRYLPGLGLPNEKIAALVGPMIFYLLPLLIAYTGGRMVHDVRGGLAGAVATMGIIVATNDKLFVPEDGSYPQFLGAMVVGPLAALGMKGLDRLWDGKIRPGFEMLVNNFSLGLYSALAAIVVMFLLTPVLNAFTFAAGAAVDFLIELQLLPLTAIFIEPAKVLFLNNAINHGILTPLGTEQALHSGSSILLLLETNPGPGVGILLAYMFFGRGVARATAPGAAIIQFVGGIHEVYFPYVLMKPVLLIAAIGGGASGIFVEQLLGAGLRSPASPGSILALWATAGDGNVLGVSVGVLAAAVVSFVLAAVLLRFTRFRSKSGGDDLAAAVAKTQRLKGKASDVLGALALARPVRSIVFACDAGMGSSAMGASLLRDRLKIAGLSGVKVVNKAIASLDDSYDLVVVHEDLLERAAAKTGSAAHVAVDNFLESPVYNSIVESLSAGSPAPVSPAASGLRESAVRLSGSATSGDEAIAEAGGLLVSEGLATPEYVEAMLKREALASTYMGNGLAIPHGTKESKGWVRRAGVAVVRYPAGLEWQPGKRVEFVVAVAADEGEHLGVLSALARVFTDPAAVERLRQAVTAAQVVEELAAAVTGKQG